MYEIIDYSEVEEKELISKVADASRKIMRPKDS